MPKLCNNISPLSPRGLRAIAKTLSAYIQENTFDKFIAEYISLDYNKGGYRSGKMPVPLVKQDGVAEATNITEARDVYNAIEQVLTNKFKFDNETVKNYTAKLRTALNIVNSGNETTVEVDNTTRTYQEFIENEDNSLQNVLTYIYGYAGYRAATSFQNKFKDSIVNTCIADISKGTTKDLKTESLNKNIEDYKQSQFENLVNYLKETFPGECNTLKKELCITIKGKKTRKVFDVVNYNQAIILFKNKVLGKKGFFADIEAALTNSKNENFKLKEEHPLLKAVNAFTALEYFDGLLTISFGNCINIKPGTKNKQIFDGDKYSFGIDHSHERKSWQNSENYSAEKATALLTKTLLSSIPVYDLKTGKDTGRTLNTTHLINAISNFKDYITFEGLSNIKNRITNPALKETFENAFVNMHENPTKYVQELFEVLFALDSKGNANIFKFQASERFSSLDINVLYSIYRTFFDKSNPNSFINNQAKNKVNASSFNITEDICSYMDNNVSVNYLTTEIDSSTGAIEMKNKSKYHNNVSALKYVQSVNHYITSLSNEQRQILAQKYPFELQDNGECVVKISDNLTLKYQSGLMNTGVFYDTKKPHDAHFKFTFLDGEGKDISDYIFDSVKPDKINLECLGQKFSNNNTLTPIEQSLKDLFQYFDDISNSGFMIDSTFNFGVLEFVKNNFTMNLRNNNIPLYRGNSWLDPFLTLALRCNTINDTYIKATEQNLEIVPFLYKNNSNDFYKSLTDSINEGKLFVTRRFKTFFVPCYSQEPIAKLWADAQSFYTGEASIATTKDHEGNNIPNNSMAKLGCELPYYLKNQRTPKIFIDPVTKESIEVFPNTSSLLFASNPELIKKTYHDLDVTSNHYITKKITDLSPAELGFHSIFNKFWNTYLSHDKESVIIQPTTYSDKTTILNWLIGTNLEYNGKTIDLVRASQKQIYDLYNSTIGETYKKIYKETINKLEAVTQLWAAEHNIPNYKNRSCNEIMHLMKEGDLTATASKMRYRDVVKDGKVNREYFVPKNNEEDNGNLVEVQLDKDYRVLRDKTLGINELLLEYADLYTTKFRDSKKMITAIAEQWAKGKKEFKKASTETILSVMTENDLLETAKKMRYSENTQSYVLLKSGDNVKDALDNHLKISEDYIVTKDGHIKIAENRLENKLNKQKRHFIKDLINSNMSIQVISGNDNIEIFKRSIIPQEYKSKNPVLNVILQYFAQNDILPSERIDFFNNWIDQETGNLILAKQSNQNIINPGDKVDLDTEMELNPFLDTYFNVESFLAFNLRMSLTGSEIGHPVKNGSMYDKVVKAVEENSDLADVGITTLLPQYVPLFQDIIKNSKSIVDLIGVVGEGEETSLPSAIISSLQKVIDQTLIFNENTSQGTQLKRNQIIPATLHHILMGSLQAPPSEVKVAVFKDDQAPVFNYRGEHKKDIDACDGGGAVDPLQRVLENRALGPNAVGRVTKPIWHGYDTSAGCATQIKFAAYTITNELMRRSLNSECSMYNTHKEGKNLQWRNKDNIDLDQGYLFKDPNSTASAFTVIGDPEKRLYYKNKFGQIIKISDLQKVKGDPRNLYYTTEVNKETEKTEQVYHLFYDTDDDTSIHITANNLEEVNKLYRDSSYKNLHSINSLYELFTVLGDVYCCDKNGKYNEYNHEVIANYVCSIGSLKNNNENQIYTQESVNQPLKDYYIGYYLNKTTMKSAVKNINPVDAWRGKKKLQYFKLSMAGWGIQMNADAEIVDSQLTEFSQVITACAAYGYTIDNCTNLYDALAQSAIYSSKSLTKTTDLLMSSLTPEIREQVRSDLYQALGKILFVSSMVKDEKSLSGIILQGVKEVFNKNSVHYYDESKIPFSETSVYSTFITQLTNHITQESIKRKHPGHGCVMVPSYNIMQYYEVPNAMGVTQRLSADEVIKKAMTQYRGQLIDFLNKNKVEFSLTESISSLEEKALKIDDTGMFSDYYSKDKNAVSYNKYIIETYLHDLQHQQEAKPLEYFQPTDIVEVLDKDGHFLEIADLSNMGSYYAFKNKAYPDGTSFRRCVTKSRNLRPSLIRWQYIDDEGNQRYMNYFDLPHVKEAYENGIKKENQVAYRKQVQQALHDLHAGFFYIGKKRYDIIPGSLENSKAEVIMGNMYKNKFGITTNSINEILETGVDYFKRIKAEKLDPPVTDQYDVAYIKGNGKHTLIKVGPVNTSEICTQEVPFTNLHVLADGSIMLCSKDNNDLFQIGKWEEVNNIIWNESLQSFVSTDNIPVADQSYYRINNNTKKIEKRIDYVKRYNLSSQKDDVFYDNTLYQINREAINNPNVLNKICNDIYKCGNYTFPQANLMTQNNQNALTILNSLSNLSNLSSETLNIINVQVTGGDLQAAKQEYIDQASKKAYTSFLDSMKVIAARIPAQTLQSYMPMEIVSWGETGDNYCYVSHFQTFLQGSDYDIDKAYIMGQNYDDKGIYLAWSPFFSYDSLSSLEASKELPTPKGNKISLSDDGAVIDEEIDFFQNVPTQQVSIENENGTFTKKTIFKSDDPGFIRALGRALNKAQKNNGKIRVSMLYQSIQDIIVSTLQYHESYQIADEIVVNTYKNVASANIFNIAHDIRNRDQAYTEIAMNDVRESSENTPKGEQVLEMNLLNPMTKLIMQYQNLVGKDVISVAANGEKFWFNTYYYWTQKLLYGTPHEKEYLKFQIRLWGIKGRAKGTKFDPDNATSTFNHLPDLDITHNNILRQSLFELLGIDEAKATKEEIEELEGYKYVDQMISQLLSAATDNAKELILAKINAGTNFAKMFLFLMTAGEDINDIAAFMTSPTAEFIVSKADQNIFQMYSDHISPNQAINLAIGSVNTNAFLHGSLSGEDKANTVRKVLIAEIAERPTWEKNITNILSIVGSNIQTKEGEDPLQKASLNQIMQCIIFSTVIYPDFKASNKFNFKWEDLSYYSSDYEVGQYYKYCKTLSNQLKDVYLQYQNLYPDKDPIKVLKYMIQDADSFKQVFGLATEMSQITTSLLSLNQGLPSDFTDIIIKLNSIKKVITQQEQQFKLNDNKEDVYAFLKGDEKNVRGKKIWLSMLAKKSSGINDVDAANYFLTAYDMGMVGDGFDPVKMICNEAYRDAAKNYLEIIRGSINAIDLVYTLPQYKAIMDCFRATLVSQQEFSIKYRMLTNLLSKIEINDEQKIKKLASYIDDVITRDFIKELPPIDIKSAGIESTTTFDEYWDYDTTSMFDFNYFNHLGGFKLFMETTFVDWVKATYPDNPLVKHLTLTSALNDLKPVLTTNIDLLNPDYTEYNQYSFDECVRGIKEFEQISFGTTGYTVADLFQLYNILVHKNKNNRTSLTPLFRACTNSNNIMHQYYRYIADLDYSDATLTYQIEDARIAMAPLVSAAAERVENEPFIRVREPNKGEVLKYKSGSTNSYKPYNILPVLEGVIDEDDQHSKFQRYGNFQEYCPFEMPKYNEQFTYGMAFKLADLKSKQSLKCLKNAITNLIASNRLNITINC